MFTVRSAVHVEPQNLICMDSLLTHINLSWFFFFFFFFLQCGLHADCTYIVSHSC